MSAQTSQGILHPDGCPAATDAQREVFAGAMQIAADAPASHNASVVGSMEDDGLLLIELTEDGMTMLGRFNADGGLVGDWIV